MALRSGLTILCGEPFQPIVSLTLQPLTIYQSRNERVSLKRWNESINISYIEARGARQTTRHETSRQRFARIRQVKRDITGALCTSPSISLFLFTLCLFPLFCVVASFLFLPRNIYGLTGPLITFIELPCRFRSYSSIVPITANQSRT